MLSILATILGPVLGILDKIFGYVSSTEIAKVNAEATVDVATTQAMGAVEKQWWFVSAMIPFISLPVGFWIWKALAWDKIVAPIFGFKGALATTDAATGTLGWVIVTVVSGLFLHAMVKM